MRTLALFLTVSSVACVLSVPLFAEPFSVKADVPFAFVVNGKTMPAGEYTMDAGRLSPGVLMVRNSESADDAIALGQPQGASYMAKTTTPELIFNRVGDRYFLSQVWTGFNGNGIEVSPSRDQKKAAREQAANEFDTVVVAALR